MKIDRIIHRGHNAKILYEAAEMVFLIPPHEAVVEAVERGNLVPIQEFLEKTERMHVDSPFSGPTVFRDIMDDDSVYIHTDGGREIYVSRWGIKIDFERDGEGSVIAAGEVLGRYIANDGDTDYLELYTDDGMYLGSDYTGPVHENLGKITYRSDFAKAHPALLKACIEAAGDDFCIPMYPGEGRETKMKLQSAEYNTPVLISYTAGDKKGQMKGTALEIGEKLGQLVEKESRPSFVENIIDAIADDIGKPETNTLEFENVQVVVLDILEGEDSCAANT